MKINKSEAEKVLEFAITNDLQFDNCKLYCAAMRVTGNECKNGWTNRDVIDEVLLAYEKTLAPKP